MPKYSNSLNWRVNVKFLLFFVWFTSILCWCKKSSSSSVFWNCHTAMNQDLSLDKQTYCPLIVLQVACLHRPYVDNRFFRPNLLTLIFIMIGRKIRNITIIFLCCICCKEVYTVSILINFEKKIAQLHCDHVICNNVIQTSLLDIILHPMKFLFQI